MRLQASAERPPAKGRSAVDGLRREDQVERPAPQRPHARPGFNRPTVFEKDGEKPIFRAHARSPLLFDRALHRKRLDRAASGFAAADFLQRRAALDLASPGRIMRDFPVAVDLSARNGAFREALAQSLAAGRIGLLIEADLSRAMLAGRGGSRAVLDEERLPFAAASLDLVVSTLGLHWTNDVVGALIQIRQALKPDGLFLGPCWADRAHRACARR